MSSVAERRKRKAINRFKATMPKPIAASNVAHGTKTNVLPYREKTGLEWLVHKKRITERQARAGRTYGEDFRTAQINGTVPLKSCLNDAPGGSDSGRTLPPVVYQTEAQDRLRAAQAALSNQEDLLMVAEMICARQLTPWQAVGPDGSARDVAKIEAVAGVALDLLEKHYRRAG